MAILHEGSTCAICGRRLERPYTATSGCAFAQDHELFEYCDAPSHLDCLAAWPHRREFSQAYYDQSLAGYRSGAGSLLHASERWFLACGPVVEEGRIAELLKATPGEPTFIEVRLAQWPFRLYSRWTDWNHYVL